MELKISYLDYLVDPKYSVEDFIKEFKRQIISSDNNVDLDEFNVIDLIELAEMSGSQNKVEALLKQFPEFEL